MPACDVLHISASVSRQAGGILESMLGFARGLSQTDYTVAATGLEDPWSLEDVSRWAPVPIHHAKPKVFKRLGYSPELRRTVESLGPKLIHLHGLWMYPSKITRDWRRHTGQALIISPHGMLQHWALRHARLKKAIVRRLYEDSNIQMADCLHALTQQEAQDCRDFGYRGPIAVIPNGVHSPKPTPDPTTYGPGYADNSKERRLLFLGRLHPKKGLDDAITAFNILVQEHPDIYANWGFVIAGSGSEDYVHSLKHKVKTLNLESYIHFVGPVYGQQKSALFELCDAFILPSHSEGLPMAVLEAASHGLSCFVTRHCNFDEALEAGVFHSIQTDAKTMAKDLHLGLGATRADLQRKGARARAYVNSHYSWEKSCQDMKSVIDWLLRSGDRPGCVWTD